MFHSKYHKVLITFFMALFMSAAMSFAMSVLHFNGTSVFEFFLAWLNAWSVSFAVALPITFLVNPFVFFIVKCLIIKPVSA